jgi:formylmethanofuran dehydrogenase subunit C
MTVLTLTLKEPPRFRLDVQALTPHGLAGRTLAEVAALPLWSGNRLTSVGALFDVSGAALPAAGNGEIVFVNATERLDRVGSGMHSGAIRVEGDAGAYPGFAMSGGWLTVTGNAGPFAGSAMRGGEIRIGGSAGDFLGAAIPGEKRGMSGGVVVVEGSAGDRVGDHMRRGNILIGGDAGDYCGARMTAGSIVVRGKAGGCVGFAMRRGTVLLYRAPAGVPATFNDCGSHDLPFLGLYMDYLRGFGPPFARRAGAPSRARRIAGDVAVGGRGEILILES